MEPSDWASRRKTIILTAIVILLSGISFLLFWRYWYRAPTCSDGLRNGDEAGIDCGGSCAKICSGEAIRPIVRWDPRLFEISPGLWSVLVYVENPNTDAVGTYVPYKFTVYDANNRVLEEREGATILPKNKTVGIFEGNISVEKEEKPKRATFEIGEKIIWQKNNDDKDEIEITHGSLLKAETSPRVEATVKNNGSQEVKNIELIIAIFDGSDNAIAASRTLVDSIPKNGSSNIFFTWPKPFDLGIKACEKPSDVVLLLDRSGSMAGVSQNPPEPLSKAKGAAVSFIEKLNPKDQVGVVSFASEAKEPADLLLSSDLNMAKTAVESVKIEQGSTQYTNIYEALHSAWQELISGRVRENSSKIAILLTDGVANNPRDPKSLSESDDIKYAEGLALKEAESMKNSGLTIYAIGLGNNINESFLKSVASGNENYFFAPTASDLEKIYKNISSDICKEVPARIEITYRIFGPAI